jgi:hypothetical protein
LWIGIEVIGNSWLDRRLSKSRGRDFGMARKRAGGLDLAGRR